MSFTVVGSTMIKCRVALGTLTCSYYLVKPALSTEYKEKQDGQNSECNVMFSTRHTKFGCCVGWVEGRWSLCSISTCTWMSRQGRDGNTDWMPDRAGKVA